MKKTIMIVLAILQLFYLVGCNKQNINDSSNTNNENSIEFFIGKEKEAFSKEYIISKTPMFTDENIDYYDWNSHKIVFKDDFLDKQAGAINNQDTYIGGSRIFNTKSRDKFFVYVNGELIYEGFYNQSLLSSFMPVGAIMVDQEDGVIIEFQDIQNSPLNDNRDDSRIYDILSEKGILKE